MAVPLDPNVEAERAMARAREAAEAAERARQQADQIRAEQARNGGR